MVIICTISYINPIIVYKKHSIYDIMYTAETKIERLHVKSMPPVGFYPQLDTRARLPRSLHLMSTAFK